MPELVITDSVRRDRIRTDHALSAHGIDAAIGERCRHQREIARAVTSTEHLAEVDIEHLVDVALDDPVIVQEISGEAVAVAREPLGGEYRLVDVELAPREAAERVAGSIGGIFPLGFVNQPEQAIAQRLTIMVEGPIVGGGAGWN